MGSFETRLPARYTEYRYGNDSSGNRPHFDEPGSHSGQRKPSRRQSQGLQNCGVTLTWHGRLKSPLV
jgi:hypothetical protein